MSAHEEQRLLVLQSLWAMERRHTDGIERSLEENVEMIAAAGFDGVSTHWTDRSVVAEVAELLNAHGMTAEGQCFPKTVDDLKPVLEIATEFPLHHLDIQPDVRPRRIEDCLPLLEGWMRLAEEVDFPVYIETHRDRMTTDLYFTLDLLDRIPELPLLADLSHFLVGREFAYLVSEENHALIERILDASWAFHGRVASREQVQIEISFPAHRMWVELFERWWTYGFLSWRRRSATQHSHSPASSARSPMQSSAATATTRLTAGSSRCNCEIWRASSGLGPPDKGRAHSDDALAPRNRAIGLFGATAAPVTVELCPPSRRATGEEFERVGLEAGSLDDGDV